MLKPVLGLAATGVVAVLAWKLVLLTVLPLVGMAVGLLLLVFKVVFLVCAVLCAIWLVRRLTRKSPATA